MVQAFFGENNFPSGEPPLPWWAQIRPPQVFNIGYSPDKTTLVFEVGDPAVPNTRRLVASYRIYFAPMSLANSSIIGNPSVAANVFVQSTMIASSNAPLNGGNVMIRETAHAGLDGWFFATGVSVRNIESEFRGPVRNPIVGIRDSRIAPDVTDVQASLTDGGLDPAGRQLVKVSVSARVPYQSQGVSTITVSNSGSGYTSNPLVAVDPPPSGTTALAQATINDAGEVIFITVTDSGSGYVATPAVTVTGGGGSGATAVAVLTTTGSFAGMQIYLANYFSGL